MNKTELETVKLITVEIEFSRIGSIILSRTFLRLKLKGQEVIIGLGQVRDKTVENGKAFI